jgi:pimeloyl-ACP methyl ester carboxylesterase
MTSTATAAAEPAAGRRFSISEQTIAGPHGGIRSWASAPRHGLPVLLIHGYGALIEHWRPVMRPLVREHTLFALDLYGFGFSARPAGLSTRERWAEQVSFFIREVIGEPAIVVGHSMGGVVATETARSFPELVRGLVLVNSSGMQPYARPLSATDRLLLDALGTPLLGGVAAGLFANPWGVRQGLLASYHRKERVTDELVRTFAAPLRRFGAESYLNTTRNAENLVITLKAGEFTKPALLIWGEEDQSIPPSDAAKIKELVLPQAEIRLLTQSGHCPFDETPEAFLEALLPWLRTLEHAA